MAGAFDFRRQRDNLNANTYFNNAFNLHKTPLYARFICRRVHAEPSVIAEQFTHTTATHA
jgi:hypothetical protein